MLICLVGEVIFLPEKPEVWLFKDSDFVNE